MDIKEKSEYVQELIRQIKDDLFENYGIELEDIDSLTKEMLDMAVCFMKRGFENERNISADT